MSMLSSSIFLSSMLLSHGGAAEAAVVGSEVRDGNDGNCGYLYHSDRLIEAVHAIESLRERAPMHPCTLHLLLRDNSHLIFCASVIAFFAGQPKMKRRLHNIL